MVTPIGVRFRMLVDMGPGGEGTLKGPEILNFDRECLENGKSQRFYTSNEV